MTLSNIQTSRFLERVSRTIDEARLLTPRQRVLVACSGGADSVALLHVLARLAEDDRRGYELTVAHLDHGIREAAVDDADFVEGLAHELDLPCIQRRVDVPALADEYGEGVEHAAREARYAFLGEVARECGCQAIAVAHHADDNVETILFRMLRGSALRGLAGMPLRRPLTTDRASDVEIVRPLLDCRQYEILDYLRAGGIRWREDETNDDPAYKRNFIRHELLPTIRWHLNERVDDALLRLSGFARQAEAYIAGQADTLLRKATAEKSQTSLTLSATRLAAAEPILCTTALRLALEHLNVPQRDLSAEHLTRLDELVRADDGSMNLPGKVRAKRTGTQLILGRQ